jgi:hypothetical protein
MNCPQCAGANFGWAKKCDHCGYVFTDENVSQTLSVSDADGVHRSANDRNRQERQILESSLPVDRDELQFDHVIPESSSLDTRGSAGVACSACQQLIPNEYYEINGHIACQRCRLAIEATAATPTGAVPFMTAALCGFGASIAGAFIHFAVLYFAHLQIGIVAILIGYMVGYTVRKGASGRGGLRFQIMAVALTYGSVALAYVPIVVLSSNAAQSVQHSAAASPSAPTADPRPREGQPRSPFPGVAMVLAFIAVLPVLVVLSSLPSGLISAFIMLIGMQQAWRMTGAATLSVFGPYRVGAVLRSEPS